MLQGRPLHLPWPNLLRGMVTRDLFAVACRTVKNNNKKNSHRQLRSSASASNRRGLNPIKLTYDRDQPDNLTAGAFNELSQIVNCDIPNDVYLALILRLACFFLTQNHEPVKNNHIFHFVA